MISILAESLRRLYRNDKITIDEVKRLYANGRITKEEYTYIKEEGEAE